MVKKMKIGIYDNNKCVIENYSVIKIIENNRIIIDCYQIYGKNLQIKQMDEYLVVIKGDITKLIFGDTFEI